MINVDIFELVKVILSTFRKEDDTQDMENAPEKPPISKCPPTPEKKEPEVEGPDGTRAWIVALAACMINFIMAGLGRMSGILYVAFIEEFQVDRKRASTPFSLRSSIRNLLGPIVGILGQKYGIRLVCMTGGALGTLSAAGCFFTTDIVWLTVLWGGLNGVGSALTVILPQVVIGQYFEKHRTTASGMAFSGGCIGSFLFPMVLEHFILKSGIEGTFLIMAGIIMNTIPAAMILRRPPWLKNGGGENSRETDKSPLEPVSPAQTRLNNSPLEPVSPAQVGLEKSHLEPVSPAYIGLGKGNLMNSANSGSIGTPSKCINKNDFKNFPDVQLLKQNSHLIVKMLTLRPLHFSPLAKSPEAKLHSVSDVDSCIREELEDVFRCISYSDQKSRFYKTLGEDYSFDTPKRIKAVSNVKSRASRINRSSENALKPKFGLVKASSAPDISKISKEISSSFVWQKFKDLFDMNQAYVAACFPDENKRKILRLLTELQKLYKTSLRFDSFGANTLASENRLIPQDYSRDDAHANSFLDHLKTAVRIHGNPLFVLVCLCRAVHFVAFIPVMTTVVDFVIDKGLQEQDGKYAIGALSLGDLLGRLCLGWVTDRGYLSLGKYMLLVMILQGASTASLPLMQGKVSLFANFSLFGMLQGSLFVRHPVLVSKYMDPSEQSIAMGCINFFSGILGFGLPYYIGYFRDTLGSYDYIFFINGALGALVGLLWSLEPYFTRRLTSKLAASNALAAV